jgi:hypothetical protein
MQAAATTSSATGLAPGGLEYINESDTYFGFIVVACDRAIPDVTTIALIEHLAENLPVLVDIATMI